MTGETRTGWWTPAQCFIDCCGSVQPTLLNEAFRRTPQYRFFFFSPKSFCCSEVWCRFGPCPGESLLHLLPVIDSFCIVPYSPCLMGWVAFVAKGFVLIFKVVWPHVGADLVKTACPLLLL